MAGLFDLFGDKSRIESDLVSTEPKSLGDLSLVEEDQDFLIEKVSELENVELKVDYSDFDNFVFFNSALDYFNITGEKILNEYPFDESLPNKQRFKNSLDGYQKYLLGIWPSCVGHLRFDTSVLSSYIEIEDFGYDGGIQRGGLLSPSSGSFSIEMWLNAEGLLTGSDDAQILFQKSSGTVSNVSIYLSGTNVYFQVKSGSTTSEVSAFFQTGSIQYLAAVMDRTSFTGSLVLFTGSQNTFPVVANSSSLTIYDDLDLGTGSLFLGSGSLSGKTIKYYSGSLDEVKLWKTTRTKLQMSSSFNVKQHSEKGLYGLYRFSETGSAPEAAANSIIIDSSGKRMNGRIINYFGAIRGSGTLLVEEEPEPILNIRTSDISEFIIEYQNSGSDYDRQNANIITSYVPENFLILESENNTKVMENFLYVMARHYDSIKLHIDQFINILTVKYGDYNQAPDQLLDVVGKFFGWEFTGNFLNADAFQYLLGKNVYHNTDSNKELETKLYQVKYEFWRRVLLNLMYFYKTKGTRESIKALLRTYGVNENFVRIKEYGTLPDVGIRTNRIKAEKSVYALGIGSGSLTGSVSSDFSTDQTGSFAVEGRFRFPLTSSANIQATEISGTLMKIGVDNASENIYLQYQKDSLGSHTGTLILSSSDGTNYFTMSNVGIFNNDWYNFYVVNDHASSSVRLEVRSIDEDEIYSYYTASLTVTGGLLKSEQWTSFGVGGGVSTELPKGEYWVQEARFWSKTLTKEEMDDHALNFQSYGVCEPDFTTDNLKIHWRLDEGVTSSLGTLSVVEFAKNSVASNLNTSGFVWSTNPYKKFLNDYNYIASLDFGWNQDKIRIYNKSEIYGDQVAQDAKIVSLEFNLMDALNEDIVQMLKSLDFLNNALGFPGNKYRVGYDELEIIRHNYFSRLQGKLNFTTFANMLDFFDRNFLEMVKKLIPARSYFMGDEFVVESHLLERSKVVYEKRKEQDVRFEPQGSILMWSRFGRNEDKSGNTFPLFLTGSIR